MSERATSQEIPVIHDPYQFSQYHKITTSLGILTDFEGGLIGFAEAIFPEASPSEILAISERRSQNGRGAHFDVYQQYIHKTYPWIGVYNLTGECNVTTAGLPDVVAKNYFENFPDPTDEAFEARRDYSAIALKSEKVIKYSGKLAARAGLILNQPFENIGKHIVHEVVPVDSSNPGNFVKLVIPGGVGERAFLEGKGYTTLDELVTSSLASAIYRGREPAQVHTRVSSVTSRRRGRTIADLLGNVNRDEDDSYHSNRSYCNLD